MDLNAYHKAWMGGATESEACKAGEEAYDQSCFDAYESSKHAKHIEAEYDAWCGEQYDAWCRDNDPNSPENQTPPSDK